MRLPNLLLIAVLAAGPASGATITEIKEPGPRTGLFALKPANFVGHGTGGGRSVKGDPTKVSVKTTKDPNKFGRHNPIDPKAGWIDSNDMPGVDMKIAYPVTFRSFVIGVVDAHDQPARPAKGLGESFFRMTVNGARIAIPEREKSGTIHYYRVMLDEPTKSVTVRFRTRKNDGFGIIKPMITRENQAPSSGASKKAAAKKAGRTAAERREARAHRERRERRERGERHRRDGRDGSDRRDRR